jgi:uncharacterized protein (UPF0335 family)
MSNIVNNEELRLFIERIERLEEEKKGIGDDVKDVYSEAKAVGYDAKIMRQIVRLRKMDGQDRREMEMMLDTYKAALGLDGTPLGDWSERDADLKLAAAVKALDDDPLPLTLKNSKGVVLFANKAAQAQGDKQ